MGGWVGGGAGWGPLAKKRGGHRSLLWPKSYIARFFEDCVRRPIIAANFSHTSPRGHRRRHNDHRRGGAMRDIFESEIPDTAPYKEWLGIVGSMLVAVLICAVLFAGGVLT